jgi:hypothetical protein
MTVSGLAKGHPISGSFYLSGAPIARKAMKQVAAIYQVAAEALTILAASTADRNPGAGDGYTR